MTRIITKTSIESSKALLRMAVAAVVALGIGSVAMSAHAEERHDDRRGGDHRDDRGRDGYRGGYGGGWGHGRGWR